MSYRDALLELLREKALAERARYGLEFVQPDEEAIRDMRHEIKDIRELSMQLQDLRGRQSPPLLRPCLYDTDKIEKEIRWYRRERLEREAENRNVGLFRLSDYQKAKVTEYLDRRGQRQR